MKKSIGAKIFDAINYPMLLLFSLLAVYPFLDMLQTSLSSPDSVSMRSKLNLLEWFKTSNIEMYKVLLGTTKIQMGYYNSIKYTIMGVLFGLALNSLLAYPMSKRRIRGRMPVMVFVTITMFFSGGMIPSFLLIKGLGWLNTTWAIVIPGAFSAWNMIMMRTFFQTIPDELEESAQIEGASDLFILIKIYLPLSKALYATMALFLTVSYWNSWFSALIYLDNEKLHPIQLILRNLVMESERFNEIANRVMWEGVYFGDPPFMKIYHACLVMIIILPLAIMYPFVQKYFVKGIMIGSIKG